MDILSTYFVFVLILALTAAVIVFNFWRYRFTGDRTGLFLGIFIVLFVANIFFTLSLFDYSALTTRL